MDLKIKASQVDVSLLTWTIPGEMCSLHDVLVFGTRQWYCKALGQCDGEVVEIQILSDGRDPSGREIRQRIRSVNIGD